MVDVLLWVNAAILYCAVGACVASLAASRIENDHNDLLVEGDIRPFLKGALWPLTLLTWLLKSLVGAP